MLHYTAILTFRYLQELNLARNGEFNVLRALVSCLTNRNDEKIIEKAKDTFANYRCNWGLRLFFLNLL